MIRTFLLFAFSLCIAAHLTAAPAIHPLPQQEKLSGITTSLSTAARIAEADTADATAIASLKSTLAHAATSGKITKILIGKRGDKALAPYLKDVPEKSGAYHLHISGDLLVIAGHDARGTNYALRTLEQILEKDGTLPEIAINDWPDVEFRGAVEGFYGTPWSHANRLSLIEFFGKHKLNTYIYGPKDDPFHSSPNWRKPYPEAEATKIRELAAASAAHQMDFVWAIHPGKDIKWTDEDFHAVMGKFQSMYDLGVRSFAVFFDDISGEGTKADKQAELLNRLNTEFVKKKPDVTPLVMCPTQYNKAWSGGDYLETLGNTLDKSIHIMWTGNSVVADMDRPSMEWINQRIKRPAYIWWNFPVTDYVRNHLLMGPVYGNGTDIKELLGGFVSNPMERSEASKIALFSVADYSWNLAKYHPEASWKAAIREIMPRATEAFETFSRHNSDLGPNGHGYRRVESEVFAPIAQKFMENFRQEKPLDSPAVRAEFLKISAAPAAIREGSDNPALISEISPWLDAFAELGKAGIAAIDANTALLAGKGEETWNHLAEANTALAAMDQIDRTENQNPYQSGIKTGSLVLAPMIRELIATTNARFVSIVSGRPVFRPTGITSSTDTGSLPLMLDGKDDTFFYDKNIQKGGEWFGVDLGGLQEIQRIRIAQGRNDADHDMVHTGVLEGSADGEKWDTVAEVSTARIDITLTPAKKFRIVRLRVTKPGSAAKPDVWTAIRSFEINPQEAATLRTDIPAFATQPVRSSEKTLSISPSLEVHPVEAGKYLGLLLPAPAEIKRFQVDLKTPTPEKTFLLEATADGREWKTLPAKTEGTTLTASDAGKAIAVRVRNNSRATASVTLAKFEVKTAATHTAADPTAALTDGNLATLVETTPGTTVPVPSGAKAVTLLTAPGSKTTAKISALIGSKESPLGELKSSLNRFPIPAGTTAIRISAPASLHQIIWTVE